MSPSSTCWYFLEQAREGPLPAFVFIECQPGHRGQSSSIHESLPSAARYLLRSYANLCPQNPFPINSAWLSESLLWPLSSLFQASASLPSSTLFCATWLHLLLSLPSPTKAIWLNLRWCKRKEQGPRSIILKTLCAWESLEVPFNKYILFSQFWGALRNLQEVKTGGSRTTLGETWA